MVFTNRWKTKDSLVKNPVPQWLELDGNMVVTYFAPLKGG